MRHNPLLIKAVVFHLESTLCTPTQPDENARKVSIGCPPQTPLLEFIRTVADPERKKHMLSSLEQLELAAVDSAGPAPGAEALVQYVAKKNLKVAVFSHNGPAATDKILQALSAVDLSIFNSILCRQDLLENPRNTNTVRLAAEKMNVPADRVAVVTADANLFDQARQAGSIAVLIDPSAPDEQGALENEFYISRLSRFQNIVRLLLPLPAGKLPNDLLREFLDQFVFDDPSIIINPGVGEDTAAVNVEPEQVLVLKSDPITFATNSIGQYAVLVNANDIATSGAKPRWLLTTLLFPPGITALEIRRVIDELKQFCRQWEITLCGGHTEITDAVTRPVVTGMMAGTVTRRQLVDKRNMRPGDRVLLTKAVAVEGTAIIAREFGDRLKKAGMTVAQIDTCREFLSRISILPEAQIAGASEATSAMHDVTEGGLATAIEELSIAGGHRIDIDMDAIPVFAQTNEICHLLHINPLGLIGSGSLLICCRQTGCEPLMEAIHAAGVQVSCIGKVMGKGHGITATREGQPDYWPRFDVDEITRLF
jgi:hydrogenase maturation factor/phosphoglycolate phosphatase-like HAD superfamily hydrolase